MGEIENVSPFDYRVWRIKRWFFMNAVSVLLFAGLLLSAWAVFSIDIPLILDKCIRGVLLFLEGQYRDGAENLWSIGEGGCLKMRFMGEIENVSPFDYRVWRIKRWFFMNAVSVLLFAGLLLSAWAVFSIDIPLIPKIPCSFSDKTIEGLNRAFLALAYSYIAGVIIYGMTVKYPYCLNKKRLVPVINAKVKNIGVHLSNMNLEFRDSNNNPPITDVDGIMALFKTKRWKERCNMPEHSGCKDVTDGFVKDYGELKAMLDALINDYKEYLSGEQMIYLEAIRGNRLNQFFRTYEKSNGNCDYTDEFYELVLQPEYRMLILLYYSLCKVSGIKV